MQKLPRRVSKAGPVIEYLMQLHGGPASTVETQKIAREAMKAVKTFFDTEQGIMVLELLEKSTTDFFLDPLSDPRACDALNAQRFIALDLRRIASDEFEHVLEQNDAKRAGRARSGGNRPAGR